MCEICHNFPTDVESTRIVANLWEICHGFHTDFTRKHGQQFTPIQWVICGYSVGNFTRDFFRGKSPWVKAVFVVVFLEGASPSPLACPTTPGATPLTLHYNARHCIPMTLEDVRGYIKVFKRNRSLREEKAREAKEEDDKIKRAKALELVREDLEDMVVETAHKNQI
ncbi:hypothetical protein Tco_0051274 [Tanacetum coccineum]